MKDSILHKLSNLKDRYEELEALLSDGEVIGNQDRFRSLSKEFAEIEPVVKAFTAYQAIQDQLQQAREMHHGRAFAGTPASDKQTHWVLGQVIPRQLPKLVIARSHHVYAQRCTESFFNRC